MEETDVSVFSQTDMLNQVRTLMSFGNSKKQSAEKINTKNILFIVSGAFDKLGDIVKKRMGTAQIGFGVTEQSVDQNFEFLTQAQTEDFIKYGFEPEFIGRLPVRVACKALGEWELEKILSSAEGSIVRQYREDFLGYGIDLSFDDGALKEIAKEAVKEKTGARGLLTVLERIFRNMKFELPSTTIRNIALDAEGVRDPGKYLENILKIYRKTNDPLGDIERFVESFEGNFGIHLSFTPAAVEEIEKIAETNQTGIVAVCNRLFEDFGYGLQLLLKDSESKSFEIPREAVRYPDQFLSEQITSFYKTNEQGGILPP
jgi:ATP-dependent protease Clp ATPase subunit